MLAAVVLVVFVTTTMAVYQEEACEQFFGSCMHESNCNGYTASGLCPTQPRSIKCCLNWMTGDNSAGSTGTCGCEYDYADSDSGGDMPGAIRIYSDRNIGGSRRRSLHGEGRAVDLMIAGNAGQQAFDHAIEIACDTGIQEVIFNRRIWTGGNGVRAYNGQNPHTDHVHIGLNTCGAQNWQQP